MANFLLVRDPDQDRRRRTIANAGAFLSEHAGRQSGSLDRGPTSVTWALWPDAPLGHAALDRRDTILLGDLLAEGPGRLPVADYATGWDADTQIPPAADGYHLAITITGEGTVTVATDPLGLFPVYFTEVGEALLATSSPALLGAHPGFRNELDPLGLSGLLLINSLLDGVTIQRGVRRLAPGHVLQAAAGRRPAERLQYSVPVSATLHDLPGDACGHLLHEAMRDACRRHLRPDLEHTLLLSGGLDSRLLAGLLTREGTAVTAVTRGHPADIEYRCARAVARQLGMPHHLLADTPGAWHDFTRSVRWNGLVASPGMGAPAQRGALGRLGPRVVSGYLMDSIVGGSHIGWAHAAQDQVSGFEPLLGRLNAYGVPVETLRRLLRPEVFGDAMEVALDALRRGYESLGDGHLARAWRFDLQHRQRFYVGAALARRTEGAWPVAPHIDRGVLEVAGGIPLGLLAGRRLEIDLLRRYYPALARLPLDRNSLDTTPLAPDLGGLIGDLTARAWRRLRKDLRLGPRERRYYYRVFDFNGPHWRAIRHLAEPRREAAYALFDRATFDALLPPPDQPWSGGDGIVDVAGAKLLLGLLAWLDQS